MLHRFQQWIHSLQHYLQQKDVETTWMTISRWTDKEDAVHLYNGILVNHKNEWNWVICRDVNNLELVKVWQKEENKYCILMHMWGKYILTHMWDLEKWHRWYLLQYWNRDTDLENKFMDTKGRKWWVGWIGRLGLTYVHCWYYV